MILQRKNIVGYGSGVTEEDIEDWRFVRDERRWSAETTDEIAEIGEKIRRNSARVCGNYG